MLYEDDMLLVVQKPARILSQPANDNACQDMATLLTERQRQLYGQKTPYIGVVHRLDCGVGGLMVYAKKSDAAGCLSRCMADGMFRKEYLCVTEGMPPQSAGTLTDLLFRDMRQNKVFVVDRQRHGVKKAELSYETAAICSTEEKTFSLLRVRLSTGRSHQIRAQLSHIGVPIVGDGKYGAHEKPTDACPIALFSCHLSFPHPACLIRKKKRPDTGQVIDLSVYPDAAVFPWSLFGAWLRDAAGG